MNELKNVSALVKSILTEDERARNTDNYLYLRVLEHYSGMKGTDIHTMTVPVFLKELDKHSFPALKPFAEAGRRFRPLMKNLPQMKRSAGAG